MTVSGVAGPCGVLQSDSAANWLGAIGTVGAFAVALTLAWIALRDRQRQQARLLSGHFEFGPIAHVSGTVIPIGPNAPVPTAFDKGTFAISAAVANPPTSITIQVDSREFTWRLTNRSDEMFADVFAELLGDNGDVVYRMRPEPIVPPGYDRVERVFTTRAAHPGLGGGLRVRVTFTDASGRRWSRLSGEPLRRVWRSPDLAVIDRARVADDPGFYVT